MSKQEVKFGQTSKPVSDPETLPWVEKYRPQGLDDVLAQKSVVSTIERLIDANRLPHLLLYGPPGTGKTSTILACARKLYGDRAKSMILELNASDDRGIDVVRNQIKTFASSQQIFAKGCKLIILDEADSMTKAAQFALRRIVEKYTKNTRFCIICNYINKIIPALQSRCTRFRFSPLASKLIVSRLREISKQEGINVSEDGINAVMALSNGDMRKCLNIMQCTNMAFSIISEESVYECTGNPRPKDIEQCLGLLLNESYQTAINGISEMQRAQGLALIDIVSKLHPLLMLMKADLPKAALSFALVKLADLEFRLTRETTERIQLGSLVGLFQIVREITIAYYESKK